MTTDWPRHRFYIDAPLNASARLQLSEETSKQISRVLRLRYGDEIVVFNGDGREFVATIIESNRAATTIEVTERSREGLVPGSPEINLYMAMIKSDRFDLVVQKATELGVSSITPIETERVVVSLTADRARSRVERWQRIAIESLEQSERSDFVRVTDPVPYSQAAGDVLTGIKLIAAERTGNVRLATALRWDLTSVHVIIGPEGGFTQAELELAESKGWNAVSLGPTILRSETAAIASVAMIRTLTEGLNT